jgi:hypothetical protein
MSKGTVAVPSEFEDLHANVLGGKRRNEATSKSDILIIARSSALNS